MTITITLNNLFFISENGIYSAFNFKISRLSFALLIKSNLEDYSHQFQVYLIAATQKMRT